MKNITAIDYEDQPKKEICTGKGKNSKIYPLYEFIMKSPIDRWACIAEEVTREEVHIFRSYLATNKQNRSRIYLDYMKENNIKVSIHMEKQPDGFYKMWVSKIKKE